MANRTPTDAKANRCETTEGAQQCLRERHPKASAHTWGPRGETKEWHADNTPKLVTDPAAATDQLPVVPAEGFGVDEFGTDPDTGTYHPAPQPRDPDTALEDGAVWRDAFNGNAHDGDAPVVHRGPPSVVEVEEANGIAEWHPHILRPENANGEARPMPGGSIGHIVAGTALESLDGTPEDVADEKTHGELVVHLLFEIAAESWRHKPPQLADAAKLLQVEGMIRHMLAARGLLPTPAEVETANGGGGS